MRASVMAVLLALSGDAMAQDAVFKCTGEDGIATYESTKRSGARCEVVAVTHDPRWHSVATGANGDLVRVDLETATRDKNKVSLWVQYIHFKERRLVVGKGYAFRSLQREMYDCSGMTSAMLSYASFDEDNKSIDSGTSLGAYFSPVIPDTVQESVWRWACKQTPAESP